uniref:Uncharacterized protein n=1 Tax=Oryza sativa subsp. japonica TaxID=39947 RepID=Q6ZAX2_ORYSJ|nr:hypothetical protein [Oryza sativa Japonica Group]
MALTRRVWHFVGLAGVGGGAAREGSRRLDPNVEKFLGPIRLPSMTPKRLLCRFALEGLAGTAQPQSPRTRNRYSTRIKT